MADEKLLLEKFAKAFGVENVLEDLKIKKAKETAILESMQKAVGKINTVQEIEIETIVEEKSITESEVIVEMGRQPEPVLDKEPIVNKYVKALSKITDQKGSAEQNSIPDIYRRELDIIKKSIADFHRFAQRHSQLGGGGEVNLRHLDDVNRSSIADGLYLRYDAATKKFVFDDPVSSPNLLNVASDIIPSTTLTYTIGNTTNRWAQAYIDEVIVGANSITFQDVIGGNPDQTLSLANQVFYITQGAGTNTQFNANAGFNAGGIILQNYTIQLANASQNLVVGSTSVNNSVVFNQNIKANTTITFTDNTVQNTAYKVPNVRIANVISNSVLIDFSTDNFVHIHTNQGTVTANIQNLTAGKVVELFIFNNVGGTQQFNHGVSSTQATGGQSFYLSSHNTMYVKYFCLDGTANNTFVAAIT